MPLERSVPSKAPQILFLDAATVDLGDLDLRHLSRQGVYSALRLTSQDPLPPEAEFAEVLISNKYPLGAPEIAKLPRLRLICVAATGTNNVDLQAARARGVAVSNVAGYSTATVVEHAVMFLLALGHRLTEHDLAVKRGDWSRAPYFALLSYPFSDVKGKRLGIVGFGTIGRKVAQVARALGMEVLVAKLPGRSYAGKEKRVTLIALLRRSDFVSLHCPLTERTAGLIGKQALAQMKPGAFLLNLARGPLVVETAVAEALRSGRLAGYASDVIGREPPPPDHPLFAEDLQNKVLWSPHIAWASRESRQRLVDEIAENIRAFRSGKKRNRVV